MSGWRLPPAFAAAVRRRRWSAALASMAAGASGASAAPLAGTPHRSPAGRHRRRRRNRPALGFARREDTQRHPLSPTGAGWAAGPGTHVCARDGLLRRGTSDGDLCDGVHKLTGDTMANGRARG